MRPKATQLPRRKLPEDKNARAVHDTPIDATGRTAKTDIIHTGGDTGVVLHLETETALDDIGGGTMVTE